MAQGSGGVVRCWISGAATKRSGADGTTGFDPGTDAAQASTLHEGISPQDCRLACGHLLFGILEKENLS
jgi:hypothetical protein